MSATKLRCANTTQSSRVIRPEIERNTPVRTIINSRPATKASRKFFQDEPTETLISDSGQPSLESHTIPKKIKSVIVRPVSGQRFKVRLDPTSDVKYSTRKNRYDNSRNNEPKLNSRYKQTAPHALSQARAHEPDKSLKTRTRHSGIKSKNGATDGPSERCHNNTLETTRASSSLASSDNLSFREPSGNQIHYHTHYHLHGNSKPYEREFTQEEQRLFDRESRSLSRSSQQRLRKSILKGFFEQRESLNKRLE